MNPELEEFKERVLKHVVVTDTGCWELPLGNATPGKYRKVALEGESVGAHRVSYEAFNGPIPEGMVVCHSCDNPACVNPSHLRVDTQSNNIRERDAKRRGNNSRKTHCAQGHEFTPENTLPVQSGARVCRTCTNEWNAAKRQDPEFREDAKERHRAWSNTPVDPGLQRTHCKRGHALTGDNLKVRKNGYPECKECNRMVRKPREAQNHAPMVIPERCSNGHRLTTENTYIDGAKGRWECRQCGADAARSARARRARRDP